MSKTTLRDGPGKRDKVADELAAIRREFRILRHVGAEVKERHADDGRPDGFHYRLWNLAMAAPTLRIEGEGYTSNGRAQRAVYLRGDRIGARRGREALFALAEKAVAAYQAGGDPALWALKSAELDREDALGWAARDADEEEG